MSGDVFGDHHNGKSATTVNVSPKFGTCAALPGDFGRNAHRGTR